MNRGLGLLVALLACGLGLAAAEFPKSAENGALRLTVEAVRVTPNYGDRAAPAGRQWCVVRGRWENRIDKRRAAERELATALEVGELAKHLYLVIDGATVGALQSLEGVGGRTSLSGLTIANPGGFSAGDMVFEIPAGAYTSAELRYYDDTAGHFELQLTDEMFRVAVGARRTAMFAGEAAGEGREFLVLDVGVENTGAGGEYFQPESQLQLAECEGEVLGCDEITGREAHCPETALYVPAGERRRCELVFRIAAGASPKLSFTGGSSQEQYALPEVK